MTQAACKTQAKLVRLLRGEVCVRARVGQANTLLLDFGVLHDPDRHGYRESDKWLVAECPWRLERKDAVVVGNGDAANRVESPLQACVGKRLVRITVYRPSYMLHLRFDNDLRFWLFPDDAAVYAPGGESSAAPWYVGGRAILGDAEDAP